MIKQSLSPGKHRTDTEATPSESSDLMPPKYIDLTVDLPAEQVDTSRWQISSPRVTSEDTIDRFSNLPPELLHIIFGFLFARHRPDKAFFDQDRSLVSKLKQCLHPLDAVCATSKALRAEVNEWAVHFLLQHKNITPAKLPKHDQESITYNALRGRNGLLTWSDRHCVFCGKKSVRFAIMMNGFRCCRVCDGKEWPNKITKTRAQDEYDLREHHLLPLRFKHLTQMNKVQEHFPDGIPRIRYGTFMSCRVLTTMFLREDVEWLAKQYHPDLEAHLAKRKLMKEENARKRQQRQEQLRAAKEAAVRSEYIEDASDGEEAFGYGGLGNYQ